MLDATDGIVSRRSSQIPCVMNPTDRVAREPNLLREPLQARQTLARYDRSCREDFLGALDREPIQCPQRRHQTKQSKLLCHRIVACTAKGKP